MLSQAQLSRHQHRHHEHQFRRNDRFIVQKSVTHERKAKEGDRVWMIEPVNVDLSMHPVMVVFSASGKLVGGKYQFHHILSSTTYSGEASLVANDDGHNDAKEAKRRAENFNDQDLDEQRRVLRIGKCGRTTNDAHAQPADEWAPQHLTATTSLAGIAHRCAY